MKIIPLGLLVAATALAACEPNADGSYGEPGTELWFETATVEQRVPYWRSKCIGFGHAAGSTALATCVEREERSAVEAYQAALAASTVAGAIYSVRY